MTWLAGMVLLVLVYYLGSGLIDPDVADISKAAGIAIGLGALVAGWLIYDVAVQSPLGQSQAAFAVFASSMTAAASWGLMHRVQRTRRLHPHGSDLRDDHDGERVVPDSAGAAQNVACGGRAGATFDASLGAQAKLRSKHNTFMAVPVVFLC